MPHTYNPMDEAAIRPLVIEELERWGSGTQTWRCGSFLDAVLRNDLATAIGMADDRNLATLPAIVSYVWRHLPSESWGSDEIVHSWLALASARAGRAVAGGDA